jgi:hypothetical protein
MSNPKPNPEDDPWSGLVVAILSVNSFPVDRTWALLDRLRAEKLTDPANLSQQTAPGLYSKLVAAGYDRGEFMTYLFAERLSSLGAFTKAFGIAECEKVIKGRDANAIKAMLLAVNGIGPAVMRNFFFLRQI